MVQKYLGEDVKLFINVDPVDGNNLDTIDWTITLWCVKGKSKIINKSEAISLGNGDYVITFNTDEVGEGTLQLRIDYATEDSAFANNQRLEFDIYKIMKIIAP